MAISAADITEWYSDLEEACEAEGIGLDEVTPEAWAADLAAGYSPERAAQLAARYPDGNRPAWA